MMFASTMFSVTVEDMGSADARFVCEHCVARGLEHRRKRRVLEKDQCLVPSSPNGQILESFAPTSSPPMQV